MTIEIIPIAHEHISRFHETLDAVARESGQLAQSEAPPLDSTKSFVTGMIENDYPQFVAMDGEQLVGWCDAMPKESDAKTGRLGMGVLQSHRLQGIGRRLIKATLKKARAKGMQTVVLSVNVDNAPAIALYEKVHFTIAGRETDFETGRDIYIMACPLEKADA
ncbi:MAG: GNAT family N-acetyltransferase [Alphaproteobacteria bacterium]|nr:GNAT family N-acetyltransferase [Alphaproteobacteria bacterium]